MFKQNPNDIQNNKCFACMFCVWNEERQKYVCDIKGCFENSKYIEFELNKSKERGGDKWMVKYGIK